MQRPGLRMAIALLLVLHASIAVLPLHLQAQNSISLDPGVYPIAIDLYNGTLAAAGFMTGGDGAYTPILAYTRVHEQGTQQSFKLYAFTDSLDRPMVFTSAVISGGLVYLAGPVLSTPGSMLVAVFDPDTASIPCASMIRLGQDIVNLTIARILVHEGIALYGWGFNHEHDTMGFILWARPDCGSVEGLLLGAPGGLRLDGGGLAGDRLVLAGSYTSEGGNEYGLLVEAPAGGSGPVKAYGMAPGGGYSGLALTALAVAGDRVVAAGLAYGDLFRAAPVIIEAIEASTTGNTTKALVVEAGLGALYPVDVGVLDGRIYVAFNRGYNPSVGGEGGLIVMLEPGSTMHSAWLVEGLGHQVAGMAVDPVKKLAAAAIAASEPSHVDLKPVNVNSSQLNITVVSTDVAVLGVDPQVERVDLTLQPLSGIEGTVKPVIVIIEGGEYQFLSLDAGSSASPGLCVIGEASNDTCSTPGDGPPRDAIHGQVEPGDAAIGQEPREPGYTTIIAAVAVLAILLGGYLALRRGYPTGGQ